MISQTATPPTTQPMISFQNAFVSVVVPVFNEAENIIDNIQLLIQEIETVFGQYEIIVVSDGSTDGTNSKLMAFDHPAVITRVNGENKGKGYAVRSGFKAARGDYVFFIDGGMELHPRELRIFLGLMALYDADIVVGSKRHPQSKIYYPIYRRFLSRLFQALIHRLFHVNVTDTQVGIKLLRKDVVTAILPDLETDRYGFDLEILSLATLRGYGKILEAPIQLDYFVTNKRPLIFDLLHVLRIGLSLVNDTWKLHRRLEAMRKNDQKG